jgi:hypothetical protein
MTGSRETAKEEITCSSLAMADYHQSMLILSALHYYQASLTTQEIVVIRIFVFNPFFSDRLRYEINFNFLGKFQKSPPVNSKILKSRGALDCL